MEPTIENIVKALKACAQAHHVKFIDGTQNSYKWADLETESVPVIADVRTICEAFYGHARMFDAHDGFTFIHLSEFPFAPAVNETLLAMALPHGTKL